MTDLAAIAEQALAIARKAGADAVSVVAMQSEATEASVRDGKLEQIERSEDVSVEVKVFAGEAHASVSSGLLTKADLEQTAERALAMARLAPPDPLARLAEPELLARMFPELELADPASPSADRLAELAIAAEQAARAVPGITNTAGAGASMSRSRFIRMMSNGFAGEGQRTSFGFSASVIAGSGTGMERDYDYTSATWLADLEAPEIVGRRAGERAAARLNPRKLKSQSLPVVFDPRVASGLISNLASAASGSAVARGSSFLKDSLGKQVFAPGITIIDDPLRPRQPGSRAFDSDGLPVASLELIADGRLASFLLDLRSSRQLGMQPTGHGRGPSAGPSNLWLTAGPLTPQALMADIGAGFYVTELLGHGANMVTGDYSRGASGFFIENGKLTFPVSEVTIAGNLKSMWAGLSRANDLRFRGAVNAPTCRVEGMTLAGA